MEDLCILKPQLNNLMSCPIYYKFLYVQVQSTEDQMLLEQVLLSMIGQLSVDFNQQLPKFKWFKVSLSWKAMNKWKKKHEH